MVRVHSLGSRQATTLERAPEETRIFANAHRGNGLRATGRVDSYDDPMDLTFQAPLARHAESARPPMRPPPLRCGASTAARRVICGQRVGLLGVPLRRCHLAGVLDSGRHARRAPMRMLSELGVRVPSVLYVASRPTWRGSAPPGRLLMDARHLGESKPCSNYQWIVLRCGFRLLVTTHPSGFSLPCKMRRVPCPRNMWSLQVFYRGPVTRTTGP